MKKLSYVCLSQTHSHPMYISVTCSKCQVIPSSPSSCFRAVYFSGKSLMTAHCQSCCCPVPDYCDMLFVLTGLAFPSLLSVPSPRSSFPFLFSPLLLFETGSRSGLRSVFMLLPSKWGSVLCAAYYVGQAFAQCHITCGPVSVSFPLMWCCWGSCFWMYPSVLYVVEWHMVVLTEHIFIHLPFGGYLYFLNFQCLWLMLLWMYMFEIHKRKITVTLFFKLCVSVFQFVYVSAVAHIGRRACQIPLCWSYRQVLYVDAGNSASVWKSSTHS